ncbi:CLUMA_CG001370, isoform A [Clunio marinus]|uniref:CLUMA_CG001370, isoform A n=1 Tax=Clunio marinus TaxID=568069 RepID=A0A1J1HHU4_9DIPT|nr:CLUMA_CG001370, isoform A [Clunio marinus]
MKGFLILCIIVSIVLAPASAQIQCAPPNCAIAANRALLFPHDDPTLFWQCSPGVQGWIPVERPCQCLTFFYTNLQRCEFPFNWTRQCIGTDPNAVPRPCPPPPDNEH